MEKRRFRYFAILFSMSLFIFLKIGVAFAVELNVMDYGAVGDGVTDDRRAIQSALDAIPNTSGGKVYLPPGVYKVNAPINIKKSNTSFVGAGATETTLFSDGLSQTLIVQPSKRGVSNILIKDIRFTNPATPVYGIGHGRGTVQLNAYTKPVVDVTITGIVIDDTPLVGIVVGADKVSILNSSIRDTGQHGIYLSVANDVKIEGNEIHEITVDNTELVTQSGIKVKISNNVLIKNNRLSQFHANSFGILVGRNSHSVSVINNQITLSDKSQVGLRLHSNSVSTGNIIDGGIGYPGSYAIDVKEGTGALISDTQIIGDWMASPVIVRSPAVDTKFNNIAITKGSESAWQFNLNSSTRPVVQWSSILGGGYGINLGRSVGAKILNNIIKVNKAKYSNGLASDFTIVDGNH